jgi:hypothetical protein
VRRGGVVVDEALGDALHQRQAATNREVVGWTRGERKVYLQVLMHDSGRAPSCSSGLCSAAWSNNGKRTTRKIRMQMREIGIQEGLHHLFFWPHLRNNGISTRGAKLGGRYFRTGLPSHSD